MSESKAKRATWAAHREAKTWAIEALAKAIDAKADGDVQGYAEAMGGVFRCMAVSVEALKAYRDLP